MEKLERIREIPGHGKSVNYQAHLRGHVWGNAAPRII